MESLSTIPAGEFREFFPGVRVLPVGQAIRRRRGKWGKGRGLESRPSSGTGFLVTPLARGRRKGGWGERETASRRPPPLPPLSPKGARGKSANSPGPTA